MSGLGNPPPRTPAAVWRAVLLHSGEDRALAVRLAEGGATGSDRTSRRADDSVLFPRREGPPRGHRDHRSPQVEPQVVTEPAALCLWVSQAETAARGVSSPRPSDFSRLTRQPVERRGVRTCCSWATASLRPKEGLACPTPEGESTSRQLAARGGVVTASLPCTHHPRIEDSLLNQILLAGLRSGRGGRERPPPAPRGQGGWRPLFEEHVSPSPTSTLTLSDQPRRQVNRLTAAYEPATNPHLAPVERPGDLARGGGHAACSSPASSST